MNTLKFIIVLFLTLSVISVSHGQTKSEKVKSIRQVSQKINSDTTLKTLTLENEDFFEQMPDGGGSLIGHFKNKSLLKITEWIGLSFGIKQFEYYFDKGKLIFVYATEKHFKYNDSLQQLDHDKLNVAYEGRYYFDKDKLIETKTKGIGSWDDPKALEQLFIEDAQKYYKLLISKRK